MPFGAVWFNFWCSALLWADAAKGLFKNYVAKNVGMKSTRFSSLVEALFSSGLNTNDSTKLQQSCRFVEFLVFNSAFGRHSN